MKMILTDPPYLKPELYGRLAELAAVKLMPGGLCLAYAEPGIARGSARRDAASTCITGGLSPCRTSMSPATSTTAISRTSGSRSWHSGKVPSPCLPNGSGIFWRAAAGTSGSTSGVSRSPRLVIFSLA